MPRNPVLLLVGILVLAALPVSFLAPANASGGGASLPGYLDYRGPVDPTFFPDELPMFVLAGEPSIGVNWNTGKAFFQHGFDTYRIEFDDATLTATWTDVTAPSSEFNVDPILWTDAQTGRTFAGGLDGACSILAFTDDDGATWTPTGNACVATLDHQSIVSGPWAQNLRPLQATSDRAVYYCAQASFVTCMTSFDGGLTFVQPSQVSCQFVNPGLHGSLHIGPRGHVFLPFKNCGGMIGMAVTANNGRTWTTAQIPGTVTPAGGFDPDVATTTSGWLYAGFANGTGGAHVALSKNNGTSWTTPVDVGASLGLVNTTFHEMVAGDDERAALAFLGTTTPGDAFNNGFTGTWHLYVATTFDAGATWVTQQVSTDPVQRGCIWDGGGNNVCRNLLDFMDAQIDAQGRVLVGYVDGCIAACAAPTGTIAQSQDSAAVVTRQVSGKTLFAAYDGVFEALRALPGGPYSVQAGQPVPLVGKAVAGAGGYTFAWSVDAAPSGSAVGPSSFADPSAALTTFTPDLVGDYTLRLDVTDADSNVATATATLQALALQPPPPPLEDPAGDALLAGTDILAADIVGETATEFTVVLHIDDLALGQASTLAVLGIPFGADTIYTVGFDHRESPTNIVRYQVAASRYNANLPDGQDVTFELQVTGSGTTNFVSPVTSLQGTWDATANTISWVVPKAAMVVKTAPTGVNDDGVMTGGRAPTTGDAFDSFDAEVRTWFFALVGFGPGATIWDSATGSGSYTLTE